MIDWFYSDPHFGHANIIKHAGRPFADVDKMGWELIHRYEGRVGGSDMVLWCGDCAWDLDLLRDVLARLPGRKGLILGNHDKSARKMARCGFDFVAREIEIDLGGVPCIVSHYPPRNARDTNRQHDTRYLDRRPVPPKDAVVIHGHTHEAECVFPANGGGWEKRIHVGVDAWDFAPVHVSAVTGWAGRITGRRDTGVGRHE